MHSRAIDRLMPHSPPPHSLYMLVLVLATAGCTTDSGLPGQISANVGTVLESDRLSEGLRREPLTERDVAEGLREALRVGVRQSTNEASRVDGFYGSPDIRIPIPPTFERVAETLRAVGLEQQVNAFEMSMNRAAERAASEARPILIDAVRNMSITDAWSILQGSDTAATNYLRSRTDEDIYDAFRPHVAQSLEAVGSTRIFGSLVAAYNQLPMTRDITLDLTDYTTRKAMDGLFTLMAKEEQAIREDPVARTTELLQRVFGPRVYQPD